jgi:uncharacterized surface protein with fasciclin (FAS1) repeats
MVFFYLFSRAPVYSCSTLTMKMPRPFYFCSLVLATLLMGILAPPLNPGVRAQTAGHTPAATDVLTMLTQSGEFGTFVKLLNTAGIAEKLRKEASITVFAPTEEAFGKLPSGVLDDLQKPENKARLTSLLNYHLVPGKVTLSDLGKIEVLMTLEGDELEIDHGTDGKTLQIDDARVKNNEMAASNGVVHVIDSVLQP